MLTPPLFVLLFSLQLAIGSLICACCQTWTLLLGPCAVGSVLGAVSLNIGCPENNNRRRVFALALILLLAAAPALGFAYGKLRFRLPDNDDLSQFAGSSVCLEGRVDLALPLKGSRQARFICTALSAQKKRSNQAPRQCRGQTMLFLPGNSRDLDKMARNAHFRCICRVTLVEDLEKRGRAGYANYLKRMGIWSLCYLNSQESFSVSGQKSGVSNVSTGQELVGETVEVWRSKLIKAHINNQGRTIGSLLTAMVLGEKAVGLDSQLLTSFRDVGLSHVLAASGFNLTVVTFSTNWVCRAACLPMLPTNCLSFFMMLVFVLFAGNSSSVVRASLMCALAIAASSFARRVSVHGLLGAALLISILIDPLAVADPGFQLSYVAVSGIIFVVSPAASFIEEKVKRRLLRWSLDGILTVLVAQACVLPLQLYYFKQMGLLFLPANLLASLVVTPVTVAGFASSLILLVCPAGTALAPPFLFSAAILDELAALPLKVLLFAVDGLSSCRWAVVTVPPIAVWQVLIYYLVFVLTSLWLTDRLRKCRVKRSQAFHASGSLSTGDKDPLLFEA